MTTNPTKLNVVFSSNVKRLRIALNLSQAKLAEAAEITTRYFVDVETAKKFPSPPVIESIARALNVEPFELFFDGSTADLQKLTIENQIAHIEADIARAVSEILKKRLG